jgi:hypothetical protein
MSYCESNVSAQCRKGTHITVPATQRTRCGAGPESIDSRVPLRGVYRQTLEQTTLLQLLRCVHVEYVKPNADLMLMLLIVVDSDGSSH